MSTKNRNVFVVIALVWATFFIILLSGCSTHQTRPKSSLGAYVFVPNPPIPGVVSSAKENAPLSFDDEIGGQLKYDGSSVRDLPGGWRGPAFELYGMKNTATVFFMTGDVPKPGILFVTEELRGADTKWRTAYIPNETASHQVLYFTGKDPTMNAVVGIGTPLMVKAVNARTFFFAYQPYED